MNSNVTAWLMVGGIAVGLTGCSSNNAAPSGPSDAEAGDAGACVSGDTKACTTFTTPTGVTLTLGPYGAQMDPNVGTGFENAIQSGDGPDSGAVCEAFADIFKQSASLTAQLLNTTQDGISLNFAIYTVYRPATWPSGPVPVLTWGNGTCAQPEGYGALLRYIASYGFFVVAANSREVGSGSPPPMLRALDYAAAANADSTSPYYQKLDLTRVGAMGHSQGGMATVTAATDPRVLDAIIFNAEDSCTKPFLAISGAEDITGFTPSGMASAVASAPAPGAWIYYYDPIGTGPGGSGNLDGHLVLMTEPNRVAPPAADWWQMVFQNSTTATSEFVGSTCGLCDDAGDNQFGEVGLPPTNWEAGTPGAPEAGPGDAGPSGAADAGPSDAGPTGTADAGPSDAAPSGDL
jgi:hypothetical protein